MSRKKCKNVTKPKQTPGLKYVSKKIKELGYKLELKETISIGAVNFGGFCDYDNKKIVVERAEEVDLEVLFHEYAHAVCFDKKKHWHNKSVVDDDKEATIANLLYTGHDIYYKGVQDSLKLIIGCELEAHKEQIKIMKDSGFFTKFDYKRLIQEANIYLFTYFVGYYLKRMETEPDIYSKLYRRMPSKFMEVSFYVNPAVKYVHMLDPYMNKLV